MDTTVVTVAVTECESATNGVAVGTKLAGQSSLAENAPPSSPQPTT